MKKMNLKRDSYIVLVNYCNPDLTIACIESLQKAGVKTEQIIVVDNASSDNSVSILNGIDGIVLIISEKNGGFSYGNNLGIKYAVSKNCSSVILLNNDTVVAEDFFEQIFKGAENCVAVPKIYYYFDPKILWYAGGQIDYMRGRQVHFGENEKDGAEFSIEKKVDYATGCCMMIPRSVIDEVGFWDEKYFMYWEDMDYSLRLKEAGIQICYLPNAKIWHKVGMSGGSQSKMAIYYSNRNRFYIIKRYDFGVFARTYTVLTRAMKYICSFIRGNNDRVIIKAWHDYRKRIMGKVDI